MSLQPLILSLQVAAIATVITFVVGLILALWLAKAEFRGKNLIETLINLPLILPPTVLGFYLLVVLGRRGPFSLFGLQIVFTLTAAIIASTVVALPLMIQSSRAAIASVDPMLEKAAGTLGAPPWRVFFDVTLPLARRGILAGTVLAFARSLGEFGATLMVAGNIPGRTQTLPLAIYDLVQANRLAEANVAVLLMTGVAFGLLFIVNSLEHRSSERRGDDA
jgi:molybdate transport system permease protein